MFDKRIAIAMATYNGEKYVAQQIESIQNNDYINWHLYIRDDGSQDNTISIVKGFQESDNRITLIEDDLGNLGHSRNFNVLLSHIRGQGYDYFALCDQDDVWLASKLSELLAHVPPNQSEWLLHSDLIFSGEKLDTINQSFYAQSKLDPELGSSLNYLLMENYIPGCAMMGCCELLERALPIPADLQSHDWWLAIHAAVKEQLYYLPEPLLHYRQHSSNVISGKSASQKLFSSRINDRIAHHQKTFSCLIESLEKMVAGDTGETSDRTLRTVSEFIGITTGHNATIVRLIKLYKAGFRAHHLNRWYLLYKSLSRINNRAPD